METSSTHEVLGFRASGSVYSRCLSNGKEGHSQVVITTSRTLKSAVLRE